MSDYITKFTMKHEYNMTDALIKQLGEPDKVVTNPHYRSAAPMQLYLRERVAKWVEEHPDLIQKVIERRTKKPLKLPPDPMELIKAAMEAEYRKSIRQVGDKWSYSVYKVSGNSVIKTGWAVSEEDAQAQCKQAISSYEYAEAKAYRDDKNSGRYWFDVD